MGKNLNKLKDLNENYKSLQALLKAYNPWTNKNIGKLSKDFFEALKNENKDFSWLNVDRDLFEELKDKEEKAVSIDYGIPSHVRGDVKNGKVFLCLVNPNIDVKVAMCEAVGKQNKKDIKKYILDINRTGGILYKELKENGLENPGYYTDKYLNGLLKIINDSENVENNENSIYYKKISKKIVNLEAFPFRSSSPNFARKTTKDYENRFANCLVKSTSKVSMLSARIIIWKILEYINNPKDNVKPVFIFRRFNQAWKPSITNVLKEDFIEKNKEDFIEINKGDLDEEEKAINIAIDNIIKELHKEYFYTLRHLDNDNFSEITKNEIYKNNKKISTNVAKYDEFKTLITDALISQKDKKGNKGYE